MVARYKNRRAVQRMFKAWENAQAFKHMHKKTAQFFGALK